MEEIRVKTPFSLSHLCSLFSSPHNDYAMKSPPFTH